MRRSIQRATSFAAFSLALLAAALLLSTPAQADKSKDRDKPKYPVVEKMTHKNYVEKIPDTKIEFEMIAVPGGSYVMGSPKDEKSRGEDEGPQHPVTVKGMWFGKCEVTWDEFDVWWRGKPGKKDDKEQEKPKDADAVTRPTPPYADETFGLGREGNPIICVTHHCAMQYTRWLSVKTGKTYRLPTEAEWEWACRGGTTTTYSFGDDPKKLGDYAWTGDNSEDKPHPVGKKKPNPFGLYDMHGNVAEWCLDHYKKDYYGTFPTDKPTLQPVLKPTGTRFSHVVRGGSWIDEADKCRCATRVGSNVDWIKLDPQAPKSIWWLTSAEHVGFRIVRPIEEQDDLKGLRSLTTRLSK